jgi:hypothetical protein
MRETVCKSKEVVFISCYEVSINCPASVWRQVLKDWEPRLYTVWVTVMFSRKALHDGTTWQ